MFKVKKKLRVAPSLRHDNQSDEPFKHRADAPGLLVIVGTQTRKAKNDAIVRSWFAKKKETFGGGYKATKK